MARSIAGRRAQNPPVVVVMGALPAIIDFVSSKLYRKDYMLITAQMPNEVCKCLPSAQFRWLSVTTAR